MDLAPWTRPYCPTARDAELALLLRPGETRLACGRCTGVWPFRSTPARIATTACRYRPPTRAATAATPHRLRCLPALHQSVRRAKADRPFMLDVDTIATLPLDAAALQRGYLS